MRLYIQTFRKQNLNFLEILFTDFKIVNPIYEDLWNILVEHREEIARYNEWKAVKSMKGVGMEKYHALEHHYPSRMEVINKWGYDPKQLHHLLRIEEYLNRYIAGESYEKCLRPHDPKYLIDVKKGLYSLEQARVIGETAFNNITKIADDYTNSIEDIPNTDIDIILDEVQAEMVKRAISLELEKGGVL